MHRYVEKKPSPLSLPQNLWVFFWSNMKVQKLLFGVIFLTSIIWPLSESLGPYIVKLIIDTLEGSSNHQAVFHTIGGLAFLYIGLVIVVELVSVLTNILRLYFLPPVKTEMRKNLFEYVEGHSYDFFQRNQSGHIASQINSIVDNFDRIFKASLDGLIPVTISFIITFCLSLQISLYFSLVFLIWYLLFVGLTLILSIRKFSVAEHHAIKKHSIVKSLTDLFGNITLLKLFKEVRSRFYTSLSEEFSALRHLKKSIISIHFIKATLSLSMLVLMFVGLIYGWSKNWVTLGDFAFITASSLAMRRLAWWASDELVIMYKELGEAQQAYSLLSPPHEILDAPHCKKLILTKGDILLDSLSFSYPGHPLLFKNLSLHIQGGEKIGIVGYSGAGKTSFIKLLLRFYDLQSGRIQIDGQDIKNVGQESLRDQMIYLSQDSGLLNQTIRENILHAKPKATHDEILNVAKKALSHDFIKEFPDQYETLIGEKGANISFGQRQKIAMTRALLKEAPILILDEPTSALDSLSEDSIFTTLKPFMEGKTTLIIAHRLSTLLKMDRILVFEDGAIVEEGKHQDLLERRGLYTRLWNAQVNGFFPDTPEIQIGSYPS